MFFNDESKIRNSEQNMRKRINICSQRRERTKNYVKSRVKTYPKLVTKNKIINIINLGGVIPLITPNYT